MDATREQTDGDLTPLEERRRQVPGAEHPNRVHALERAYVVTDDAGSTAALYAKVLGVPQPPLQRGTVIMSNMAVFQIGPTGLGIAHPYAAGPAADALERTIVLHGDGLDSDLLHEASLVGGGSHK